MVTHLDNFACTRNVVSVLEIGALDGSWAAAMSESYPFAEVHAIEMMPGKHTMQVWCCLYLATLTMPVILALQQAW